MSSLDATLVNSIVGAGTMVRGTITVSGLLRIDGDFAGAVKTSGRVIIGRSGRADCTIDAATVVIGGIFRGTIYATDKVIALESALIIGNIYSPRLVAEAGVVLDGALHVKGDDEGVSGRPAHPAEAEYGDSALATGKTRARRRRRSASPTVGVDHPDPSPRRR